jgi:predicted Rossmann fold flavoprotein
MEQIIIIGAGAAGLTAAIFAARNGAKVTVLEHTDKAGKKILSTGNGKCNITNQYQDSTCYRGTHSEFAMVVLEQFGVQKALEFMESLGILCKEKNGYLYPRSEQAATVREALLMECKRLGVVIQYDVNVTKIERKTDDFVLCTDGDNKTYKCNKLILATGSKAAPNTGSDGSGYELAKSLGLKVIKPLPALVQLKCQEGIYKEAAGVRCGVRIAICANGEMLSQEEGELQITNYGISGIPVMQLSRFAVKALDARKQVVAVIDFFPEMEADKLGEKLMKVMKCFPERNMEDILSGFMNRKLAGALLKEMGIKKNRSASQVGESCAGEMARFLKSYEAYVTGSNSFAEAQVCQGGVDTAEIDSNTMESKKVSGLYLAGELLDIDGTCGGYNLQFAWATGAIAGKSAS